MLDESPTADAPNAADILFDPVKSYGSSLKGNVDTLRDTTGMSEADAQQHLTTAANFFSDARINRQEAESLHALLVQHMHKPASAQVRDEWATQTRRELRTVYGSGADARLAQARTYIKQHPEIARQLEASGIGSHPNVVMALVKRAQDLRVKKAK